MDRVTLTQLHDLTARINTLTGSPPEPWQLSKNPRAKIGLCANVGNYSVHKAPDGRFGLVRIKSTVGGVQHIFDYGTKKDLYLQMRAFLFGLAERK